MRPEGHQVAHAHADLTLAVIPSGMEVGSMARNAQTYEVPLGTSAPGQPPETLIHHPERKNTTAARICRIEVSRNLYQATPDEIQTSDNQGETVKNCPVCLDELKSGAGAITACGHIFHAGCCRSSEMVLPFLLHFAFFTTAPLANLGAWLGVFQLHPILAAM